MLTKEAQGIVRAMDARNRLRFQRDRQALELWVSARAVLGPAQVTAEERRRRTPVTGGTPEAGGDVRPAA